jgi:hypothetical protein
LTRSSLGTKAAVQEKVGAFFTGLAEGTEEVKRRCRTKLQADVTALTADLAEMFHEPPYADPICAFVYSGSRNGCEGIRTVGPRSCVRWPTSVWHTEVGHKGRPYGVSSRSLGC